MKTKLLFLAIWLTSFAAFAQGKIGFVNDTAHLFVLGQTLSADAGLGGGSSVSGTTQGGITNTVLPSGVHLLAGLYAGTAANALTLQTGSTQILEGSVVPSAGRMASKSVIMTGVPGGSPQYFRVIIWDSAGSIVDPLAPVPTATVETRYLGYSPIFTATPGTGITYPPIAPINGAAASTWPIANVVINAVLSDGPPVISSQPQSQIVPLGSNATLSVTAGSTSPMTYQWYKNGSAIAAATNSAYAFNPAASPDAANYYVAVSNSVGSVSSVEAALQVLPDGAPSIRVNGKIAVGPTRAASPASVLMTNGFPGGYIFYTLDGSTPTISSTLYSGPFAVVNDTTVRAMCLSADFSQSAEAPAVNIQILPSYGLQVAVTGGGTVILNPPGGNYVSNTVVSVSAVANMNWAFDHWSGDLSGSIDSTNLTMNAAKSVTAVFRPTAFPLTLSTPGGGSVTANGQTISPATYYPTGSVVSLLATSNSGWNFLRWQGTVSSTANPLNLTMNQTNVVQAIFGTIVQTNVAGNGKVAFNPPNPAEYGATITAMATPNPGNFFITWGQALSGTNNPKNLVVTNATPTVGALFAVIPAPSLTFGLQSGFASVKIQGVSGRTYVIEYATNLASPVTWTLLTNVTLTGSESNWVDVTLPVGASSATRRFYRAWTQ